MKIFRSAKMMVVILIVLTSQVACNLDQLVSRDIPPDVSPAETKLSVTSVVPTISLDSVVTIPEIPADDPQIKPQNLESILIKSPNPGAHVPVSFLLAGESDSTFEQNLVIRILSEDGTQVLETYATIDSEMGTRGNFSKLIELPTDLDSPVIMQVMDLSPKDGSLYHLSSVIISPSLDDGTGGSEQSRDERIRIDKAEFIEDDPKGLYILVNGAGRGLFENTLQYVICGNKEGAVPDLACGSIENRMKEGNFRIDTDEIGKPGNFSIRIPIAASLLEDVKLVIYSVSPMNGAIDHAASKIIRIVND